MKWPLDYVLFGLAGLPVLRVLYELRHGLGPVREAFRGGPETLSHSPLLGRQDCCEGVSEEECAEWWESYQWRWIRLGDGSLWHKVVRSSGFERELPGYGWEPYPERRVGDYPSLKVPAELGYIEKRILSGELNDRKNIRLNGWHW